MSIAGELALCCTAPPVDESLPETIEPCLEDPDFLAARAHIFEGILSIPDDDLPDPSEACSILMNYAKVEHCVIGLMGSKRAEYKGLINAGIEGYVRAAYVTDQLDIAHFEEPAVFTNFDIGWKNMQVILEALPAAEHKAAIRYAYALRHEGLTEEWKRRALFHRPTLKLQQRIEELEHSFQRIMQNF